MADLDRERVRDAGEIVCLDENGNSQFRNLLFRRGEPPVLCFRSKMADSTSTAWVTHYSSSHVDATSRLSSLSGVRSIPARRKRDVVQGQESQLFAVDRARRIIRTRAQQSRLAGLESIRLGLRSVDRSAWRDPVETGRTHETNPRPRASRSSDWKPRPRAQDT